jgi:DNA-binding MarR family transcriptional regulator
VRRRGRLRLQLPLHKRPTRRASHRLPGRRVPQALEHWTGFALIAAADAAQWRYARALEPLGLTIQEFLVISVVVKADGISAGAVGDRLGMSRRHVSKVLCTLDRIGLIGRELDIRDLRRKGIWLSLDGKELYERARHAISVADNALHQDMDPSKRQTLRWLLLCLVPGDYDPWARLRP